MGDAEMISSAGGDGERDMGKGTCEGVRGSGAASWICVARLRTRFDSGLRFTLGLPTSRTDAPGLFLIGDMGDGGESLSSGAGDSTTFGSPACGPRRLRMDEKCSQSW